jgi:hypothetical protein
VIYSKLTDVISSGYQMDVINQNLVKEDSKESEEHTLEEQPQIELRDTFSASGVTEGIETRRRPVVLNRENNLFIRI